MYLIPARGGDIRRVIRLEKEEEKSQNQDSQSRAAQIDTLRWRPDSRGLIFNLHNQLLTINIDGSDQRQMPVVLENPFFDVHPGPVSKSGVEWSPPPVPTMHAAYRICQDALDTRLDIGSFALVSARHSLPNNVRETPVKSGRLAGQIQPGSRVEIIGGPFCGESLVWWEVRTLDKKLQGFTAEADNETYWLDPSP